MQTHASVEECEKNPVQEYVVPEMTHRFCSTDVPPHHLILKKGVPMMVTRNSLHPGFMNGKAFIVKGQTRRVVEAAAVDES